MLTSAYKTDRNSTAIYEKIQQLKRRIRSVSMSTFSLKRLRWPHLKSSIGLRAPQILKRSSCSWSAWTILRGHARFNLSTEWRDSGRMARQELILQPYYVKATLPTSSPSQSKNTNTSQILQQSSYPNTTTLLPHLLLRFVDLAAYLTHLNLRC